MYISYNAACEMTGLTTLNSRRDALCLSFGLKAVQNKQNKLNFPLKQVKSSNDVRAREKYHVNFAHTEAYMKSAVPTIQRMLKAHAEEGRQGDAEERRDGVYIICCALRGILSLMISLRSTRQH